MTEHIRILNTSENEDGTLILNIPNLENYTVETENDNIIFTPIREIREYITQDELKKTPIAHSAIVECSIKNRGGEIISKKKSYRGVMVDLWTPMLPKDILLNTTFNIKLTNFL